MEKVRSNMHWYSGAVAGISAVLTFAGIKLTSHVG